MVDIDRYREFYLRHIGDIITSKDRFDCKIIKMEEFNITLDNCKFKVRCLKDGSTRVYPYEKLKEGNFNYMDNFAKEVYSHIGEERCSTERCVFKISGVEEITDDLNSCKYKVQPILSYREKIYTYKSICNNKVNFKGSKRYIDRLFISYDCYRCRTIERVTFDDIPSRCKYKVRFEDGEERVYSYRTLDKGHFTKTRYRKLY